MIVPMNWRKLIAAGVLATTLSFSGAAHAQSAQVEDPTHDARVEAYQTNVKIDGNTSLLWILFVLLSIASMSALFKDSRRARTE
jgi:hypothetical protein